MTVHFARSEYAERQRSDEPYRGRRDGGLQTLAPLKRQLKICQPKLEKVLYGFGLFICNGNTFYSPKLNEVMKPFEDRRARIEAYKRNKEKDKSLETSDVNAEKSDIVSFEVKGKGEGKGKVTTSKEEKKGDGDAVASVPSTLAWERYIDELQDVQSIQIVYSPDSSSTILKSCTTVGRRNYL